MHKWWGSISFPEHRSPAAVSASPMSGSGCREQLGEGCAGWHAQRNSLLTPVLVRSPASTRRPRRHEDFVLLTGSPEDLSDSQLGFVQLRFRISHRAIQQFGYFLVFVAFHLVQQED